MQAAVRQAAESIARRYLAGKRYREDDIARDIGLPKKSLAQLIGESHGSFKAFVRDVVPGNSKTVRCSQCDGLIQAHRKNSRTGDCVGCRRRKATFIILQRIERAQPVKYGDMAKAPELNWIVVQAQHLWGKPYKDVLVEEFGLGRPPVSDPGKLEVPPTKKGKPPAAPLRGLRARNALVEKNLNLVAFFVDKFLRRYSTRGMERADLVQEGMIGLMRAAEMFDPSRGFRFSTYANWWIRQRIERAWRHGNFAAKVPARYDLREADSESQWMQDARNLADQVLGTCSLGRFDEEALGCLGVKYLDDGFERVEDIADEYFLEGRLLRVSAYARIPVKHLRVFCYRVFGEASLGEVGERYKLSGESVRKLVSKVADKLKSAYVRERGLPQS